MINWICKICGSTVELVRIDPGTKQPKGNCSNCKQEVTLRAGKIK